MRLGIVKLKNCIFHLPLLSPFSIFARFFSKDYGKYKGNDFRAFPAPYI